MNARVLARNVGLGGAVLACAALGLRQDAAAQARARNASSMRVPPLEAAYPLPSLPERSARNANYTIDARLFPDTHTVEGTLLLEWTNISQVAVQSFPFHLYWNAFRNNVSSWARGEGARAAPASPPSDVTGFGFTDVKSVRLVAEGETDLTATLRYVQPDDGNVDDGTVMEVRTPFPIQPGERARFRIDWTSRIPRDGVGRAGFVHDYLFVAQWFPQIGVLVDGRWNAHQVHPWGGFFADYGVYDVRLTLPRGHLVAATGRLVQTIGNADGSETLRFVQEDVHDFAWTASRRFIERTGRFDERGYTPVAIRLLVQPEHAHLAERYLEATRACLRSYGSWTAPYPYPQLTVVDPAWGSVSGDGAYPTLFTAGSFVFAPRELQSPEGVTIQQCGHQFFSGLLGGNAFEEAWLDAGISRYLDRKARLIALGRLEQVGQRYFGPRGARLSGIPVLAPEASYSLGDDLLQELRRHGQTDIMARRAWEYRTRESYLVNSFAKPALSLATLEGLLGDETMTRVLRTYARRFRYAHPTGRDFIQIVNEVTGKDYQWFFDETWYSSGVCDYAVTVNNAARRPLAGFADGAGDVSSLARPGTQTEDGAGAWESEVTLLRQGDVRVPVDLLVEFADGQTTTEAWDGQARWQRFAYSRKVRRAVLDPNNKIALDVHSSNNSFDESGLSVREATKWTARFLFWLQGLLEIQLLVG